MSLQRFAAVIMRIREPKTTALIFASGKMVSFSKAFGTFLNYNCRKVKTWKLIKKTTVEVLSICCFYIPFKCHLGLFLVLSLPQ
jgi:TATA-box binding protein (TBP) (component of TFIID and TFIIIB)